MAQLMARIAAGDRQAFAALFAMVAPRIKGYLMRLGSEPGLAEELTQDVMLSVWRRAGQYEAARSGVMAWLFAIARNRRVDRFRADRQPSPDPSDPLFIPDPPAPPDAAIEMRERGHNLRLAIAELPPEQAELIQSAFYDGLAHAGLAQRHGLPLGTVKSRLRLALTRLRRRFDETPP